jgi:hypothetical protein
MTSPSEQTCHLSHFFSSHPFSRVLSDNSPELPHRSWVHAHGRDKLKATHVAHGTLDRWRVTAFTQGNDLP